jgi:ABC-type antimicrobial peptide transport system permease subunit
MKCSLVQIGLGAVIGLPIAARFVFELTSAPMAVVRVAIDAVALGLSMGIVLLVGLGSCLVPAQRILAIEANEAMRADG